MKFPIEEEKLLIAINDMKSKGVDINTKDSADSTALTIASASGYTDTVNYLLKLKADPNIVNNYGFPALLFASKYGHTDVVKSLLEAKADVNKHTLIHAISKGNEEIVKLLKSRYAEIKQSYLESLTQTVENISGEVQTVFPFPTVVGGHVLIFKMITDYVL